MNFDMPEPDQAIEQLKEGLLSLKTACSMLSTPGSDVDAALLLLYSHQKAINTYMMNVAFSLVHVRAGAFGESANRKKLWEAFDKMVRDVQTLVAEVLGRVAESRCPDQINIIKWNTRKSIRKCVEDFSEMIESMIDNDEACGRTGAA
jgi:hypothetical protein